MIFNVFYTGEPVISVGCQTSACGHFAVKCHAQGHHSNHLWECVTCPLLLSRTRKPRGVFYKTFSGEIVSNIKRSHIKVYDTLRLFPFLRLHMYYNTVSQLSGHSLKAFWMCYSLAAKSTALKGAMPSESHTWKITTVPRIHSCFVRSQRPVMFAYVPPVGGKIHKVYISGVQDVLRHR